MEPPASLVALKRRPVHSETLPRPGVRRAPGPAIGYQFAPMLARATAFALTLLLVGHAFAGDVTLEVCRYTGKVLAACPCPPEAKREQPVQKLTRPDCCELRTASKVSFPAVTHAAPVETLRIDAVAVLPPSPWLGLTAPADPISPEPGTDPPRPASRRYLALRHLLI